MPRDVESAPLVNPINGSSSVASVSPSSSVVVGDRPKKMATWKFIVIVGFLICCTAVNEFSYKLASSLAPLDVATLCYAMLALTFPGGMLLGVLIRHGQRGIRELIMVEFCDEASRNTGWAVLNESLTLISILCTIFAMSRLPASVVAPLSAVQPLYVLLIESVVSCSFVNFLRKIIPVAVLTTGVVLLSFDSIG
jgi:drug/metabolite transporter (DMT)-like permease